MILYTKDKDSKAYQVLQKKLSEIRFLTIQISLEKLEEPSYSETVCQFERIQPKDSNRYDKFTEFTIWCCRITYPALTK